MHYNCFVLQLRQFQTSATQRDIDQAAKYIGAGAATVGVAGSGEKQELVRYFHNKLSSKSISDVVKHATVILCLSILELLCLGN